MRSHLFCVIEWKWCAEIVWVSIQCVSLVGVQRMPGVSLCSGLIDQVSDGGKCANQSSARGNGHGHFLFVHCSIWPNQWLFFSPRSSPKKENPTHSSEIETKRKAVLLLFWCAFSGCDEWRRRVVMSRELTPVRVPRTSALAELHVSRRAFNLYASCQVVRFFMRTVSVVIIQSFITQLWSWCLSFAAFTQRKEQSFLWNCIHKNRSAITTSAVYVSFSASCAGKCWRTMKQQIEAPHPPGTWNNLCVTWYQKIPSSEFHSRCIIICGNYQYWR